MCQYTSLLFISMLLMVADSKYNSLMLSQLESMSHDSGQTLSQQNCVYGGGVINNSTVIELGNCLNYLYYIVLGIGTQPQYFTFQFDTGSPTLWIPYNASYSPGFNQAASSTYTITNSQGQISYGGGDSVSGLMGFDIVSVQNTPISGNQSILFANFESPAGFYPPDFSQINGLVGMDNGSYPNFLDVAYLKKQISTPVFSLNLNYQNQTSLLYYNNGLPNLILQNTQWVPQLKSPNNFWQCQLIGISAGGVNFTSSANQFVVIDSGTSLIVFNQLLYQNIVQQFFTSSNCAVNNGQLACYCNSTWPEITFNLSSTVTVSIPPQAYKKNIGSGICLVLLSPVNQSLIILGDVFFKGYVITFDRLNSRIGFYNKTSNIQTPNFTYDSVSFVIAQYILAALNVIMVILGIYLFVHARFIFSSKYLQDSLRKQMMQITSV